MTTDLDLLREYSAQRSEKAFANVVARHVDLVFSTALRNVRSAQLAEEITQSVFIDLAKNAGRFKADTVLAAWLYQVTRRTALNVSRSESRRQAREQIAVELADMNATSSDWTQIEPCLDDAMEALDEPDRAAILLRYFENKSLREVGSALGIGDDAAQKRVSRAVERLRELFSKQNVTVGTSGLAVLISANAVQAAPVGSIAAISSAISLIGATAQTSTALIATKAIAMTTIQKTLVTVAITAAVGTSLYQAYETSRLREELRTSQRQAAAKIRQIETERDEASSQLAAQMAEADRSQEERSELFRLRGEVGRLRAKEQASANIPQRKTKQADVVAEPVINNLPKASWQDAGFATPLAALQTRGYSILNSDREKFRQSIFISDDARKILMDMFEKKVAANPKEAKVWVEGALKNNWDIEEGFLMPMIAENRDKGYLGYRVLSQEETGPNETILEVETQMASAPAKTETVKMRKFGENWKFVIDDEMLNRELGQK
jgi:RNA polymerase sigma factor (sigma-70 family)